MGVSYCGDFIGDRSSPTWSTMLISEENGDTEWFIVTCGVFNFTDLGSNLSSVKVGLF